MLQKAVISFSLIFFLFACAEDKPTAPPTNDQLAKEVLGKYSTTEFKLTLENKAPIDILSVGGYIEIELYDDKTTTGTFYLPDTLDLTVGGEFVANLSGTYIIKNNKLNFEHNADTFIRNVDFDFFESQLSGSYEKSGVLVEMKLSME